MADLRGSTARHREGTRVAAGAFALATLSAFTMIGGTALAQTKEECVAAYDQTQSLRRDGQLRKARERVLACAQDACPAVVKKDCAQWLPEIEASIPTVVFEARDASGADTSDVRVLFDGAPLKDRLDGKAVPVDPGQHTFRYELTGGAGANPIEEKIVIREGDKNRKLAISFGGGGGTSGTVTGDTAGETGGDDGGGKIPVAAWVLGGVGIVGIGLFATFGIMGLNQKSDAEAPKPEGCAPDCSDDEVSSIRTKLILADVSLAVGVVSLGVATYLAVSGLSKGSSSNSTARVNAKVANEVRWRGFDVTPTRGGAYGALHGSF